MDTFYRLFEKSFTRRMDTDLQDTLCCIHERTDSEMEGRLLIKIPKSEVGAS